MAANGKATFHVSGKVNKQNVRIWGTEKPHRIVENESHSPKTNVFCAISTSKVYDPYFFPDRTVNGETFRNMLTAWLMPQLEHDSVDFVYQSTMINIFYSGHRGHRTWHPVIFSYGDTLKTMPTNHHSPRMCENCKIAFELWCKPLMGT